VIYPAGRVPGDRERGVVDRIIHAERAIYSMADLPGCLQLVRLVRSGSYDRLVVVYPTLAMRTLAALTRVPRSECWYVDNRIHTFEAGVVRTWATFAARFAADVLAFSLLFARAHFTRLRDPDQSKVRP
jgi:hypothetical protein